ncbi:hypothetical protein B0H11DRAFT_592831 [Mycena galericulata]|nr:hypothetical protein B0H11DRAFT_592831 [Mycena galericulata]
MPHGCSQSYPDAPCCSPFILNTMSLWKPSRSRKGRNSRSRAVHFNAPTSPDEIQIPEQIHPSTPNTTLSALKFTLQTLSSISTHIPIGAGLAIVIDTFLAVMTRIEQTSVNAQGLAQLVERIQLLTPIIVSETASPTSKGRVVEALKQQLRRIWRHSVREESSNSSSIALSTRDVLRNTT